MSQPPPVAFGRPARTSPLATTSLVLGIVGLLCCPLFAVSAAAVVTGWLGKRQVRESRGAYSGEGLANIGLALGLLSVVLGAVAWILYAAGVSSFRLENG
jgi:uncharacterized protein DUF4190